MDGLVKSGANIILADGDVCMRQSFRNALAHDGYRNIRAISRLSLLIEILGATEADLLILDVDVPDGDSTKLVRDVRNGIVGRNPFIAIIVTSWKADGSLVRTIIDSGADTLLVKPLAPAQLFSRIENIVCERNKFVVTADYLGPDRRDRQCAVGTAQFDVPNTLKGKLEGRRVDAEALSMEIAQLMTELNEARLVRVSYQIALLVCMVNKAYETGRITQETESQLRRIFSIAENAAPHIAETRFNRIADDFQALLNVVHEIRSRPRHADRDLVGRLQPLASAILTSTYSGGNGSFALTEIASAVDDLTQQKKTEPEAVLRAAEVLNTAS